MGWLYLAVAIVTEVIGTSALAPSQGFTKPVPTIIVLVSYAAAFTSVQPPFRSPSPTPYGPGRASL